MAYSPYDWNQAIRHRSEYIEERLRDGSPVVGLSLPQGVLFVTVRRVQRKLYEVYDRLIFGGIGHQSDLEVVRLTALDFAHREGYARSPDDVTAQRLMSFISPPLKRAFQDQFGQLFVVRGLFGEVGDTPDEDLLFALGYDGEFNSSRRFATVAGTRAAEEAMAELLERSVDTVSSLDQGIRLGLEAWAIGRRAVRRRDRDEEEGAADNAGVVAAVLREQLANSSVEAALLERETQRESRFRMLPPEEFAAVVAEYR